MRRYFMKKWGASFLAMMVCLVIIPKTLSCSRVTFTSEDGRYVVTGRSMDWYEDTQSNLWLFPRGVAKGGAKNNNHLAWVSKYGSVIVAGFDVCTTDGLNEKGLMVNLLYLAEADFGTRDMKRKGLSWSIYAQYLLDNFSSVKEAVDAMKDDRLQIIASQLPGSVGKPPSLHFSLSDETGDSAIFEYLQGKLVIHHGKAFTVMTNSPVYDEQLALNAYWETVGGQYMLPGTHRASDRFVRASYYLKQLPQPKTDSEARAYVTSVMRNVSVPYDGHVDPDTPNIAPTMWRTAANHKQQIYFFESTLSPSALWIDLSAVDFSKKSGARKLDVHNNKNLAGEVSKQFSKQQPFVFAGVEI